MALPVRIEWLDDDELGWAAERLLDALTFLCGEVLGHPTGSVEALARGVAALALKRKAVRAGVFATYAVSLG
jgi:hypothetical protein